MVLISLAVLLALGQLGRCVPTLDDLGSDLTILINNDLLGKWISRYLWPPYADIISVKGPQSPFADSGLILLTSRSHGSADAGCAALGEQLWGPELNTASIQPNLDYLAYENKYPRNQQYWIAPDKAGPRAIDGSGQISGVKPYLNLPALCTQSAPFSNSTFQDTSPKWQVAVHSNNEYITG